MKIVECWLCQSFEITNLPNEGEKIIDGFCEFKNCKRKAEAQVCEEFVLRSGMYTKRIIPEKCKKTFKREEMSFKEYFRIEK